MCACVRACMYVYKQIIYEKENIWTYLVYNYIRLYMKKFYRKQNCTEFLTPYISETRPLKSYINFFS